MFSPDAGGGSLQLCLLLVFCVAVLCCASMSISPWYKSENFLLRKTMAVLNAAAALVTESLGGDDSQPGGSLGQLLDREGPVMITREKGVGSELLGGRNGSREFGKVGRERQDTG